MDDKPRPESFQVFRHGVKRVQSIFDDRDTYEQGYMYGEWSTPEEEEAAWPLCKTPGCRNKCCRRLNSDYCHPHTILRELEFYKVKNEKKVNSEPIYNKRGEYLGNLDLPTLKYPIEIYYDYWHTKSEDKQ